MIWYQERLVRALQQARWSDRRAWATLQRRGTASPVAVNVALRPAPAR